MGERGEIEAGINYNNYRITNIINLRGLICRRAVLCNVILCNYKIYPIEDLILIRSLLLTNNQPKYTLMI